jgi:hypothetical protein
MIVRTSVIIGCCMSEEEIDARPIRIGTLAQELLGRVAVERIEPAEFAEHATVLAPGQAIEMENSDANTNHQTTPVQKATTPQRMARAKRATRTKRTRLSPSRG